MFTGHKVVLVVVVLAMLLMAVMPAFGQVFPTPEAEPMDPVDAINGGVYALDVVGLLGIMLAFVGLIFAGVFWRWVRPRGR